MPRDMAGMGRYPPQPKFPPFAFYSCARLGDSEQLQKIMDVDPYYVTQDNGSGAPIHFAVTYKQLDMVHHLLNIGAEINQRDERGFTPLHRAAYLAHHEGYLEIYEYLLSRGADPSILSENYDPYLDPGKKTPSQVLQVQDPEVHDKVRQLEEKYKDVEKARAPHEDIGDWWALYDYGLDTIKTWAVDYVHPYPEEMKRARDADAARKEKLERKARVAAAAEGMAIVSGKKVPATPLAALFPGQGSQAVGMCADCKDIPAVKEMFAKAQEVLGYDLLDVCLNGPKEKLDNTVYAQPALFVANLAALEKLRVEKPGVVEKMSACAGLSLGEYSALVFAGVMSFEDALKVVKVRSESMAKAAAVGEPHSMLSVVGLSDADLEAACQKALAKEGPDTVCQIANYLFPQGRVVSGHKTALEEVQKQAGALGALKVANVAVSGAFHTPLMSSASDALGAALAGVEVNEPRIPMYSNVTGEPFTAQGARELLQRQLCEPVRWEATMKAMISSGKTDLYELGPGAQLKAMCKRIDSAAWKNFQNIKP